MALNPRKRFSLPQDPADFTVFTVDEPYRVDPETYWTIRDQLPETVEADLAYNNAYWDQFRDSVVQQASNRIYDGMLKAYGDENGIASYGTVVDLLVAYYAT